MNNLEFYETYTKKIKNAKTSIELKNIQEELMKLSMNFCENGQYSDYEPYISKLLSFLTETIVNTVTSEVHSKHRK